MTMHDAFHEWDPTRIVHYEGITWDERYPDTSDVKSSMYFTVAQIKESAGKSDEALYQLRIYPCDGQFLRGNAQIH